MIQGAKRLLRYQDFSTAVIVPGMVYHADGGGVFRRFLPAIAHHKTVEIWGSAKTRWPLIHRDDLAQAYLTLLSRPDLTGYFNAATEPGVPVGEVVRGLMAAAGVTVPMVEVPVSEVERRFGAWASGATLDQKMGAERLRHEAHWKPQINRWQDSDLLRQLSSGALHNQRGSFGLTPR